MQSDRELEELIEAAIPGYSEIEPPLGLEQRILARSLSERRHRRRFAWQWSLAIPAMACLLILFFLTGRRNPRPQILETTANNVTTTPAPIVAVIPATPDRYNVQIHPRPLPSQARRTPQPLPKQEVFPSPTPPTTEEEAMIAFTRAQARISPQAADAEADVEIPDMHIAEFEIKPLPTWAEQQLGPSAALSAPTSQQP